MNDEKEFTSICRICLGTRMERCKSLFYKFKNMSLYDHINILTNTEIKVNDGLPDRLCFTCFQELETAINFKEKCENAAYIFKRINLEKILKGEDAFTQNIIKKEHAPGSDLSDDWKEELPVEYLEDESTQSESLIYEESDKKKQYSECMVQCHDCGSFFKSKCKLRVHWRKTHLIKSFICSVCKRVFKSFKAYQTHIRTKRKSCTAVASGLVSIAGIGKARMFSCTQCPYKTKRIKDIQTHIVVHSGDRPYQCRMCSSNYTQLSSLQSHEEMVHKKYKVEITCQFCGKVVRGRTQVYRHLKSHTDDKIPCPVCKKLLSKKSHKAHMQRHSGTKCYTCEICASAFYTGAELCNHRRLHNKQKYTYKCDLCEYKSNRSDTMKRHKKRHTDVNVPCTTCGMFFLSKQKLILHERIHFEEKKHFCPYCDAKFHGKSSVRKHIRAKHKCLQSADNKSITLALEEDVPSLDPNSPKIVEIVTSPM